MNTSLQGDLNFWRLCAELSWRLCITINKLVYSNISVLVKTVNVGVMEGLTDTVGQLTGEAWETKLRDIFLSK